ncbi:MAG: DUF2156 domain-containing protein [Myxococcales bacterium]|nr:DUF2156 domain-containing protein [Myxococcales bacterium]
MAPPRFPEFTPVRIDDRNEFEARLAAYRPETSELSFTNLFLWQEHYGIQWSILDEWLVVICTAGGPRCHALPPVGPPNRAGVCRRLLEYLRAERGAADPQIERADERLVAELAGEPAFAVEPAREHFDYLYRRTDLAELSGKKYHGKRNHIAQFERRHAFRYESLDVVRAESCRELAARWCQVKRCQEDQGLTGESRAVEKALLHIAPLELRCGSIVVDGRVAAFCLGEMLNPETAVIHIEKADPEIPGLYPLINREFCRRAIPDAIFVNREQDLGEEGLRKAKLSYHPVRLVEKFRIRLAAT